MIVFIAVLFAGLLIAGPAHAGFLVAPLAGLLGGGAIATGVANIAIAVGATLVQRALQPKQKPQGPGALSLDAPTSGDGTPQTIILGRRATAGHRTCPEYSRGSGREWMTIIRDLSDMPVSRLVAVWVGNERLAIPFPPVGGPHADWWEPTTGKFAGKFRLRFYDGTQTAADPLLLAEYGSHPDRPWQSDMVLSGVAYVIVELFRDQEVYPGVPDLLFEVEGIRLLDPRNGQMVYSDNLALMAYNIMRGITLPDGSIYGGGIPENDLPLANWSSAISEAGAQNWRGGMEISVGPEDYDGDEPYEVIDHLMQGCAGQIAESGGIWRIRIGGPGLPVATVTDRDMIVSEGQVFHPHQGPREVYNGVTAQFMEPVERWESKTTPMRLDAGYVAQDGERNVVHLTYHAVINSQRAQQLAQMALDDGRRQRMHEIALPSDYAPVEVLDTIRLSLPYDGYVNKLVEVVARYTDPVTLEQRLHVREVDPNDYTPPSVTPLPNVPVVTTPPAPQALPGWAVEPVIVQDAGGNNRRPGVRILWTPLPAEGIEWELRSQGQTALAGEGTTQEVAKGQKLITSGLINGTGMQIRGRAVLRNRARAWTAWTNFTVPNVGLGPLDLRMDEIAAEVITDIDSLDLWIRGDDPIWNEIGDEFAQIADELTVVTAKTDRTWAEGRFRVTSLATGDGAVSRIGLAAEAAASGITQTASMFMEARTDGINQILFRADRFAITTGTGANRRVPFVVDGGVVCMNEAFIREAAIGTLFLGENAVTVPSSQEITSSNLPGDGDWQTASTVTFTMPYAGRFNAVWTGAQAYIAQSNQAVGVRFILNGTVVWSRLTGNPAGSAGLMTDWLAAQLTRAIAAGTHTLRVEWWGGNSDLVLVSRTLTVQGVMR